RLLALLRVQGLRGLFPVLAVESGDRQRLDVDAVQASHVHRPSRRVEPRTDERADAAVPAEIMLPGLRAQLVDRLPGPPPQGPQARVGGSVPERDLAAADRAIAFGDATDLRVQLERHAAAMAGTTVGLLHRAIIRSVPERSPRRGRTRAARAR